MSWSFTIGRFFGVAVRVHVTFAIFLAWIAIAAWVSKGPMAAIESVVFIVLLFACVTLHEFGHILVARRFGIGTHEVTLLPIGGVASLQRMPDTPLRELAVAIAGPAVNFVIAAALFLVIGSFGAADAIDIANPGQSMVLRLAAANLFVAVFNLIPAFPMDGGRVLHALVAMRIGDARATDIAATIGQAAAFALGMAGLLWSPMLLFVAIFVYVAAAEEARVGHLRHGLVGLSVGQVMETRVMTIPVLATLQDAVDYLMESAQADFPIVDAFGKPVATTTRAAILAALRGENGNAALPQTPAATIRPLASAEAAFEALQDPAISALCVVDADSALIGLLPRQALAEAVMIRAARPDWRFPRRA